ncbi:MAG: FadR/GntR family transcriptional regulator, partial [Spirochaetota bacterium]
MAFAKIETPTPKEMFISQIMEMIFSGELKIGEKLPTERELFETMGINRSIVHAGLEELQRMGFISIEPRKGAYIADYSKTGNFETFIAIVKYARGNLDSQTSIAMVEFRNAIEGGAMIALAKRGTQEDFAALRRILEKMKQSS